MADYGDGLLHGECVATGMALWGGYIAGFFWINCRDLLYSHIIFDYSKMSFTTAK